MNESILCMNGTLQTVYDQQNEINRLRQVVNSLTISLKNASNLDSVNEIQGEGLYHIWSRTDKSNLKI